MAIMDSSLSKAEGGQGGSSHAVATVQIELRCLEVSSVSSRQLKNLSFSMLDVSAKSVA